MLTGALTRTAGEHAASYAISQGTLAANSDYTISFTGSNLTITPATLAVTAGAQTKVYGQSDPALTYVATGFQFSDTEASVLTRCLGPRRWRACWRATRSARGRWRPTATTRSVSRAAA